MAIVTANFLFRRQGNSIARGGRYTGKGGMDISDGYGSYSQVTRRIGEFLQRSVCRSSAKIEGIRR